MRLIVLSPPGNLPGEHRAVRALFEQGMECFHLRKPEMDEAGYRQYIAAIPAVYHNRIVVHDHHHLAGSYALGGVHGKQAVADGGRTASRSVHELKEGAACEGVVDYVFLSPVFDSISKKGYKSPFDRDVLRRWLREAQPDRKTAVVALGGMDASRVAVVADLGFDGLAVLGALWEGWENEVNVKEIVQRFKNIQHRCQQTNVPTY